MGEKTELRWEADRASDAGQSAAVGSCRKRVGKRRKAAMKRHIKRAVINAYCYGLIPAKTVSLIFKLFDLKHQ